MAECYHPAAEDDQSYRAAVEAMRSLPKIAPPTPITMPTLRPAPPVVRIERRRPMPIDAQLNAFEFEEANSRQTIRIAEQRHFTSISVAALQHMVTISGGDDVEGNEEAGRDIVARAEDRARMCAYEDYFAARNCVLTRALDRIQSEGEALFAAALSQMAAIEKEELESVTRALFWERGHRPEGAWGPQAMLAYVMSSPSIVRTNSPRRAYLDTLAFMRSDNGVNTNSDSPVRTAGRAAPVGPAGVLVPAPPSTYPGPAYAAIAPSSAALRLTHHGNSGAVSPATPISPATANPYRATGQLRWAEAQQRTYDERRRAQHRADCLHDEDLGRMDICGDEAKAFMRIESNHIEESFAIRHRRDVASLRKGGKGSIITAPFIAECDLPARVSNAEVRYNAARTIQTAARGRAARKVLAAKTAERDAHIELLALQDAARQSLLTDAAAGAGTSEANTSAAHTEGEEKEKEAEVTDESKAEEAVAVNVGSEEIKEAEKTSDEPFIPRPPSGAPPARKSPAACEEAAAVPVAQEVKPSTNEAPAEGVSDVGNEPAVAPAGEPLPAAASAETAAPTEPPQQHESNAEVEVAPVEAPSHTEEPPTPPLSVEAIIEAFHAFAAKVERGEMDQQPAAEVEKRKDTAKEEKERVSLRYLDLLVSSAIADDSHLALAFAGGRSPSKPAVVAAKAEGEGESEKSAAEPDAAAAETTEDTEGKKEEEKAEQQPKPLAEQYPLPPPWRALLQLAVSSGTDVDTIAAVLTAHGAMPPSEDEAVVASSSETAGEATVGEEEENKGKAEEEAAVDEAAAVAERRRELIEVERVRSVAAAPFCEAALRSLVWASLTNPRYSGGQQYQSPTRWDEYREEGEHIGEEAANVTHREEENREGILQAQIGAILALKGRCDGVAVMASQHVPAVPYAYAQQQQQRVVAAAVDEEAVPVTDTEERVDVTAPKENEL